jgi:HK97 family phage portal protein
MNLVQLARSRSATEQRYSLDDYAADVSVLYGNNAYVPQTTYSTVKGEQIEANFKGLVSGAYKRNGVVFACQLARLLLFSEARFQFQQIRAGSLGDLFGTGELAVLETPWPNGSTGELLARMIQDVDLAGNAFIRKVSASANNDIPFGSAQLERLRPDWMTIVLGSNGDLLNAEVAGYVYQPGGYGSGEDPVGLTVGEVAHWSPIPDPDATYRGMSWLTPVIREIRGDGAATDHKLQFFENAATPNLALKYPELMDFGKFEKFKAAFEQEHRGAWNAYKTLHLGGGADITAVGLNFEQMDFKNVQGAGETRIAAAAGVPPVIVGLSEGLAAATYSNYAQARRRYADMTIRPLWRSCCAALEHLISVPTRADGTKRARLWYDDRSIPALQEDEKDAADIQSVKATTVVSLTNAGYTPESVIAAVQADDFSLLSHSGLMSVQLTPPGASTDTSPPSEPAAGASSNGNGSTPTPAVA